VQTDKGYYPPATQLGPDSQTAPSQARSTYRSYTAAPFHGRDVINKVE